LETGSLDHLTAKASSTGDTLKAERASSSTFDDALELGGLFDW
jgi:hypothetical protein